MASTPEEWNAVLFRQIARTLDAYLLPPAVTAALWRAAALIPGVTQSVLQFATTRLAAKIVDAAGQTS